MAVVPVFSSIKNFDYNFLLFNANGWLLLCAY